MSYAHLILFSMVLRLPQVCSYKDAIYYFIHFWCWWKHSTALLQSPFKPYTCFNFHFIFFLFFAFDDSEPVFIFVRLPQNVFSVRASKWDIISICLHQNISHLISYSITSFILLLRTNKQIKKKLSEMVICI